MITAYVLFGEFWQDRTRNHLISAICVTIKCTKNTLNIDWLTFPVDFRDVPTFEQINESISINVLWICVEGRFTNNPQLEPYDSGKPHSYIAYLDAKNLYGTTLSEPLTTNFRFALRSRNFRLWCDDRSGRRPLAIDSRIQLVVSRTSDYATTRVEPGHLNVSLQMFSDYAREIVDRNW